MQQTTTDAILRNHGCEITVILVSVMMILARVFRNDEGQMESLYQTDYGICVSQRHTHGFVVVICIGMHWEFISQVELGISHFKSVIFWQFL